MRKNSIRILFLFIALFLVFILKSNVKAYEETYEDVSVYMPDEIIESVRDLEEYKVLGSTYNLFILRQHYGSTNYLVYFLPTDIRVYHIVSWDGKGFKFTDLTGVVVYEYDTNMNFVGKVENYSSIDIACKLEGSAFTIYSTADVYADKDGTTVFFPAPPQATTILAPVVEMQEGAMWTTLQEIVNILPMILVVVASYIGLRKALTMLWQVLRKA